eukprot:scaffold979_cov382-Prasinococcus_capsulatus_cf.AAC.7
MDTPIAVSSTRKLRRPSISLNTRTPHRLATMPGPVVIIGNDVVNPRRELAINQATCATAHMRPLTKAGTAHCAGSWGRCFVTTQYIRKYNVW